MLDRTKTPLEDRVYLLDEATLILEVYIIQNLEARLRTTHEVISPQPNDL